MKLLIIEDEWLVANFIADVAQEQHIEIIDIVDSYEKMQEAVHTHSIDLAIIDINIKGALHGIDVARYLKSKNIEFLFLTAYKDYDTIEDATDLAPLAYLTKPISQEELTASFLIAKKKLINYAKPQHDFVINEDKSISYKGEKLLLSLHEQTVLTLFVKNYQNSVPFEAFYQHLYINGDEVSNGTLRNIILKLRKKYQFNIKNIRNIGYVLL